MRPRRRALAALAAFLIGSAVLIAADGTAGRLAGAALLAAAIALGASAILRHEALAGCEDDSPGAPPGGR